LRLSTRASPARAGLEDRRGAMLTCRVTRTTPAATGKATSPSTPRTGDGARQRSTFRCAARRRRLRGPDVVRDEGGSLSAPSPSGRAGAVALPAGAGVVLAHGAGSACASTSSRPAPRRRRALIGVEAQLRGPIEWDPVGCSALILVDVCFFWPLRAVQQRGHLAAGRARSAFGGTPTPMRSSVRRRRPLPGDRANRYAPVVSDGSGRTAPTARAPPTRSSRCCAHRSSRP